MSTGELDLIGVEGCGEVSKRAVLVPVGLLGGQTNEIGLECQGLIQAISKLALGQLRLNTLVEILVQIVDIPIVA